MDRAGASRVQVTTDGGMVEFLVTLHSLWRWAVLAAGVVALVGAVGGWLGALPPGLASRRAATFYTIALDIQFLVGLILWVGRGWYATPGYYRFEHPTIMILALVVAHAGQSVARRSLAAAPARAARIIALATAVSLILVVVGIPGVVRQV